MAGRFEFGLDTFGDVTVASDGTLKSQASVLRDVVAQVVLADELGLDAFGVGEHHRRDFAISAPEVVLAAIAGRTRRILLGSAVTVLRTDDPVRVFERETVAAKIAKTARLLELSRFNLKYANGTLPHDVLMGSIELIGTDVAPRLREMVG